MASEPATMIIQAAKIRERMESSIECPNRKENMIQVTAWQEKT